MLAQDRLSTAGAVILDAMLEPSHSRSASLSEQALAILKSKPKNLTPQFCSTIGSLANRGGTELRWMGKR